MTVATNEEVIACAENCELILPMRDSWVRLLDFMNGLMVHREKEGSLIRHILIYCWRLPRHGRKTSENLVLTKLRVVTLDHCKSGSHVITESVELFSSETIFCAPHQELHLETAVQLVSKELDHSLWCLIEKHAVAFKHCFYFLKPLILCGLEQVSEEENLLIGRLHHVINHQVALV